ncbi:MAG: Enoyl-CoA hydratase [uncultured Solirubrobacteraceae bacterium]|uniref:Enoyl-CoA hydratase n=1 Tax=uncultured Solirubrobacteraceae bacterium TaxID=1162706 RepID=A0A6J4SYG0_9ACTN|nr:MAG: Enoyl-CoA hydratase [uncultured Solirubrobacteraceae bacterium]
MSLVLVEDRDAVRHIAINRPEKRNALSRAVIEELGVALRAAAAQGSVRIVVLRGEGAMFSSGMDTADLGGLAADPTKLREYREQILAIWNLCEDMAKPTIAQIHGACIGGAAELALACDLRVMAAEAVIGLVETRVGLIPDVGGCSRLPALVGLGRAKELIMASKIVDGTEAERIGLVNRVAAAADLDGATAQLASQLLSCGPLAVGLAKGVLNAAARPGFAGTLEQELAAQELCATSEDFREGMLALAEKRPPQFSGR